MLAVGVAVTLFSYLSAVNTPFESHYIIATGAIVVGIAQMFRGMAIANSIDTTDPQELLNLAAQQASEDQAQNLLNIAARLESVDRAKAIALYGEIIWKFPGTPASDEAQRNRQTLEAYKE